MSPHDVRDATPQSTGGGAEHVPAGLDRAQTPAAKPFNPPLEQRASPSLNSPAAHECGEHCPADASLAAGREM